MISLENISLLFILVSHTVQDLVFIWNMTDPLVVNPDIELPQLDIANNYTTDCTIEYSTGKMTCFCYLTRRATGNNQSNVMPFGRLCQVVSA